jgi:hypothetical protein
VKGYVVNIYRTKSPSIYDTNENKSKQSEQVKYHLLGGMGNLLVAEGLTVTSR